MSVHQLSPMLKTSSDFVQITLKGIIPYPKKRLGLIAVVLIQSSFTLYTLGPKLLECCCNCS